MWTRKNTPVCCGVKGIVAAVARATEAGTFMGFRAGISSGKLLHEALFEFGN